MSENAFRDVLVDEIEWLEVLGLDCWDMRVEKLIMCSRGGDMRALLVLNVKGKLENWKSLFLRSYSGSSNAIQLNWHSRYEKEVRT